MQIYNYSEIILEIMNYYESLGKEILSRYETISSLTQQTKIKGDYTEAIVGDFIGKFLPKNFEVGHGLVYNSKTNKTSPECDVIVYDVGRSAPIFRSEGLVIVNSRYVRIVVQVKSKLTWTTLGRAIQHLKAIHQVNNNIIKGIVGFEAYVLLKTLYYRSWKSHVVQFLNIFNSKCNENSELLKNQMRFFVENLRNYAFPIVEPSYPHEDFILSAFSRDVPELAFRENQDESEVKSILSDIYSKGFKTVLREKFPNYFSE